MSETLIIICSTLILFWLPYAIVMSFAAKKLKTDVEMSRHKTMMEVAYAGCSLAKELSDRENKERGVNLTSDEKLQVATEYLQGRLPWVADGDAEIAVDSILGKVTGEGASGRKKI